jgi:probable metal-binding protein
VLQLRFETGVQAMMEIHAHEIMHMMLEHDEGFTRESLARAITDRFGAEARFYSCSAQGMDVDAVIDFLESRGKFVARDEGFNTAQDRICNH